ncbi:MAG: hypothetical protein AB2L07_00675 [Thermoanaerobaculaceae bacterium]
MRLRSRGRACSLAFVTAAVTLFVQVLVHRVISAKLFNNFAFLVISLTMLGFAFSGVLLSRILRSFLRRLDDAVVISAALFALTTLAATTVFYRADIFQAARSRPELVLSFLQTMPYALVFAVPFFFCGLILGALLASPELPARRVYFWDLLGSAVGAFAVIPAISWLGAARGLLAATAVLLMGSILLAMPRTTAARLLAVTAGLALALVWAFSGSVFDMRYPRGTLLAELQEAGGGYGRRDNRLGPRGADRGVAHPSSPARRPRRTGAWSARTRPCTPASSGCSPRTTPLGPMRWSTTAAASRWLASTRRSTPPPIRHDPFCARGWASSASAAGSTSSMRSTSTHRTSPASR